MSHVRCTTASSAYICVYVVFFSFFFIVALLGFCVLVSDFFLIGLELISLTIK